MAIINYIKMANESIPNFIQKGYFVDLVSTFERQYQWEVVSIQDSKVLLRNLKEQSSRLTVDVGANKIKPFRTITKPSDNPGYFQKTYSYWGEGIKTCLELIKKYNNAPSLRDSGSSACEIIQFFRGYNYFMMYSLTEERGVSPENKPLVHEYIGQFLKLFLKYWKQVIAKGNFSEHDPKKLYESIDNALMSAHIEMMICLSMLLTRHSNLELGAGGQYKFNDSLINQQISWLTNQLLPLVVEPDSLNNVSFDICTRLMLVILKLLASNRLSKEEIVNESILCLASAAEGSLKWIQFGRHSEYHTTLNTLFENCINKSSAEFLECVKLKIKYLIRIQNLMSEYVVSDIERSSILIKGFSFMLYVLTEYSQLRELTREYFNHDNGIMYFIKHSSTNNNLKDLLRIFKLFPEEYFIGLACYRKQDLLKLPIGNWTPQLINNCIKILLGFEKNLDKQDLSFNISVHKAFIGEISSIQTIAKSISAVQNGGASILNSPSIASLDPQFVQNFVKQIPFVLESLALLQTKIVRQCEALYDANERTLVIEYVERNILDKYVNRELKNIQAQLDMKETNNFRQNIINKAYLSRIMANLSVKSASEMEEVISTFNRLCTSMAFFKLKSALESRKDNLITIMQKCANTFPHQTIDMLCTYVESIKNVQNRQFKNKSTDFFVTLITKTGLLRNPQEAIEVHKRLMNSFKLQNLCQLRTFMDMFKFVNTRESNLKLTEDSHLPIVIYCRPFGLDKLLDAFESCANDKGFTRKLFTFFHRFHQKILSDDETKRQMLEEVTSKLISILAVSGVKHNKTRTQEQFIEEIANLIMSLLATKHDITKLEYERMFQKISKLGTGQSHMNPTVIQEESIGSNRVGKKYRVVVKCDDIISQEHSTQGDNKLFLAQCDWDEPLYSIKWKSCELYDVEPLLVNLWHDSHKIEQLAEIATIQEYYSAFLKSRNDDKKDIDSHGQMIQIVQKEDGKPEVDSPKQEEISVVMNLKFNDANNQTKLALFRKRDVIFCCLPYTINIWTQLGIKSWQNDPLLTEIKELFISSYPTIKPDKQAETMTQQSTETDWWTTIVEEPYKKKFIFKALLQDEKLEEYKISWLAETFTEARSRIQLENNILSMCLIEKLKPKLSEGEVSKIMYNIQVDEKQLYESRTKESIAMQEDYEKLIKKACAYIFNNNQFCLFTYLMSFKHSFYQNLMANQKYLQQIKEMFMLSFVFYVQKNYHHHLTGKMLKFMQHYSFNYSFFLRVLEKADSCLTELEYMRSFFNEWLDTTVKIIIENKPYILDMQNNIPIVRNLFETVCCLLLKKTKCCESIFSESFKQIIHQLLYSKLCNQIIYIITYISTFYPKEGERYIRYFEKEMNDSEIDKKDYIKYNRNNLRHESGYVGLRNPHSVCYVNSLLQQIYHIKPFRNEIYATKWKKNDSVEQDLIYQLKKIFVNLNFKQCQSYLNSQFFEAFKNDEGSATSIEVQMDVDEFRGILFDRIQNLVVRPENQSRNLVQKYFNGKEVTIVKGKQCEHQSSREEQFSTINLDVKGLKNFESALAHYFKPEILNEENMYFCEDCNKKIVAEKKHVIKQYPKYLTFVLKRFEYIYQYRKKINERFEFPLRDFKFDDDAVYYLKGVIVHQGLSQAGHYFSLIKLMGKWFEFNDNQITEITEQDVIDEGYGQYTTRSNRNAYLLFYEKVQGNEEGKISDEQTSLDQFMRIQEGLKEEFNQIIKYNNLMWKSDLFLSRDFQNFIESSVKSKLRGSLALLFQYITTIKSKYHRPDLTNLKQLFQLLEDHCSGPILQSDFFVECAIKFYRNIHFHSSMKAELTYILARKYNGFDEYFRRFMAKCLVSIHDEVETGTFFQIFHIFAKKDPEVLKFLVDNRIIGRIYDICFQQVLLSVDRQDLAKQCEISFPIIEESKFERKRQLENSQLRYHKWKLINYILESKVELNKIEQTYIQNWATRKSQQIYQEATTKANINEISKFFCFVSKKNVGFSTSYLSEVCDQISRDRSEHLRKYLKAAADLLKIQDSLKPERIKKIKSTFSQTFKNLHKQKIMSSFDVKWQWFMKIAIQNEEFRNFIRQNEADFRILHSRSELQSLYLTRNEINSQGKNKNKYFGLKFSLLSSVNNNYLDQKFEKNKQIFELPSLKESPICSAELENHLDTDLVTNDPQVLREGSQILKYIDNSLAFKKVTIKSILGDMIEINETFFDRGDERLLGFMKEKIKQELKIESGPQQKMEQIKQVKQEEDNLHTNTLSN